MSFRQNIFDPKNTIMQTTRIDHDPFPRVSARNWDGRITKMPKKEDAKSQKHELIKYAGARARKVQENATDYVATTWHDPVQRFIAGVVCLTGVCLATVAFIGLQPSSSAIAATPREASQITAALPAIGAATSDTPLTVDGITVKTGPLRLYGDVGASPRTSLQAAGVSAAIADDWLTLIATFIDIGSLTSEDRFDVVVERNFIKGKVVDRIVYAGLYQANGHDVKLSQWTKNGVLKWFDAARVGLAYNQLQRPVPGQVSSNYGNRFHPILGYTRMHRGQDFKAGYGTPILAIQTGWVAAAGRHGGYGNQVTLTHGDGIETTYSHMSRWIVRPGELVVQGQVIGYVGSTGLATGPHLHFELHRNDQTIDPASISFTARPQLTGSDLKGYQRRLEAIMAVPITDAPPTKKG